MPAVRAERMRANAIFLPPDFPRYRAVSREVREFNKRFSISLKFPYFYSLSLGFVIYLLSCSYGQKPRMAATVGGLAFLVRSAFARRAVSTNSDVGLVRICSRRDRRGTL
jgi:hypothetical protein